MQQYSFHKTTNSWKESTHSHSRTLSQSINIPGKWKKTMPKAGILGTKLEIILFLFDFHTVSGQLH